MALCIYPHFHLLTVRQDRIAIASRKLFLMQAQGQLTSCFVILLPMSQRRKCRIK